MARLLDRVKAEQLLAKCSITTEGADEKKRAWDESLMERGDAYCEANEGGLLIQEIAQHVGRSSSLVKLEISRAKARRAVAA